MNGVANVRPSSRVDPMTSGTSSKSPDATASRGSRGRKPVPRTGNGELGHGDKGVQTSRPGRDEVHAHRVATGRLAAERHRARVAAERADVVGRREPPTASARSARPGRPLPAPACRRGACGGHPQHRRDDGAAIASRSPPSRSVWRFRVLGTSGPTSGDSRRPSDDDQQQLVASWPLRTITTVRAALSGSGRMEGLP